MPRIRKLSNQEVASLHNDEAAPEVSPEATDNTAVGVAPAPIATESSVEASVAPRRRRRRAVDGVSAETLAPPTPEPRAAVADRAPEPRAAVADRAPEYAPRSNHNAPRLNHVPPEPTAPPEPPEEATVLLLPVELPLAERRGELVHLTLGAGVTLCGTACDPEPTSSRPYSVAAGCQRCARMLHRLKARCAACERPLLHVAGNGACIRCGHIGAVIQLP